WLHLFHVADFRGEDFEHRLDGGVGERLLAQRVLAIGGFGVGGGRGGVLGRGRRGGGPLRDGGQRAGRRLLPDRFQPGFLLLALRAQRLLDRREREHDAIAGELDLLRLRDHHVVEEALVLANFGEERVFPGTFAGAGSWGLGAGRRRRRL